MDKKKINLIIYLIFLFFSLSENNIQCKIQFDYKDSSIYQNINKDTSILYRIFNTFYFKNENYNVLQLKKLPDSYKGNIINRTNSSSILFIPVDINSYSKLDNFELLIEKGNFEIFLNKGNHDYHNMSFSKKNVKVISININIIENSLYISYLENKKVVLLKSEYDQNNSYFPITEYFLNFEYELSKTNYPLIVRVNMSLFMILNSDNSLIITMYKEKNQKNIKLTNNDMISPTECFLFKIVDFIGYMSDDKNYLILGLIYYCADLERISIKYSNLFIKVNDQHLRIRQVQIDYINHSELINDLGKLKLFFEKLSYRDNKKNITTNNSLNLYKNLIFINLDNKVQIIQKFEFENILQETFYKTYLLNEYFYDSIHNTGSILLFYYLHNNNLITLLSDQNDKIMVKNLDLNMLFNSNTLQENGKYHLNLPFSTNVMEIKEVKNNILFIDTKLNEIFYLKK